MKPENKKYDTIKVHKSDERFKIYGVVIGMIRALDKKKIDNLVAEYKSFQKAS